MRLLRADVFTDIYNCHLRLDFIDLPSCSSVSFLPSSPFPLFPSLPRCLFELWCQISHPYSVLRPSVCLQYAWTSLVENHCQARSHPVLKENAGVILSQPTARLLPSMHFAVHVTLNYSYSAAFVQTQLEMTVTPLHPRPLPHPPAEEDALKRHVTKSAKRHAISSRTLASDGRVVSQRTAVISFVHFPCLRDVTPAASFIQTNKYCLVWRELSHCLCRYESYSEAGRRENYKLQAFC